MVMERLTRGLSFCTWGKAAWARCATSQWLVDAWGMGSSACVLADILLRDQELSAQVVLGNALVIDDSEGPDARQHEVLCDFIAQRSQADQEDPGFADPRSWSAR